MHKSTRTTLLALAAALMLFGAGGYTLVLVPDLHGDLIELGVRQTVLRTTVFHLYFAAVAMFLFALMTVVAALQSARDETPARFPLLLVAAIYIVFGAIAFSRSQNPHHLGSVAIGVLLGAGLAGRRDV